MPSKDKVHTVYKLDNGKRVPSVTTILGVLAKPALIHWAWRMGTEGKDYQKVRDDSAEVGTVAHALIEMYLSGKQLSDLSVNLDDYSDSVCRRAQSCKDRFVEWAEARVGLVPILCEAQFVHPEHKYGGTIDCLADINEQLTLVDFKTSNAIHSEMGYQLAAYCELLKVHGYDVKSARIIRIGQDESEGVEERTYNDLSREWRIFLACREIYELQKKN